MTLALTQSATAIGVNISASFLAVGGTAPYNYGVLAGGTGGVIDPVTGLYTAPSLWGSTAPSALYDTIRVTDAASAAATAQILVGNPLELFCDIIQQEMGLPDGRIYLWDQKIIEPNDQGLYVAVSVPTVKPIGNVNSFASGPGALNSNAYLAVMATVDIDVVSRGPDARDRKEEIILALGSVYAQQQQTANGFYIARLSTSFINLSQLDGDAIPYRYKVSVKMHYAYVKAKPVAYFTGIGSPAVSTDANVNVASVIYGGLSPFSYPNIISGGNASGT